MKLGEVFQIPRPSPWKLEIRFSQRGWDTEVLINGEPLEDVEAIELTCSPDRQPEICFKILARDGQGGVASCYGLPAHVLFKVPFSGSLKGEIEAFGWKEVTDC